MDCYELIENLTIDELTNRFPVCSDFLQNYDLTALPKNIPLPEALEHASIIRLNEFGLTTDDIIDGLYDLLLVNDAKTSAHNLKSLTIYGGHDKNGNAETTVLDIVPGEIISIVGPTGAGKSMLLADIECAARGDTCTGRRVLLNGAELSDEQRFDLCNGMVAQLSQNMNFVIDVSVAEFLRLHSRCRNTDNPEATIMRCYEMANELSGEEFAMSVKVTQLSGGQSRALMIADAACMSSAPILLIDEIENAGIDRLKAIKLLAGENKIVLLSTHDPLLALSADKRVVLNNGGIAAIIATSDEERACAVELAKMDERIMQLRSAMRNGEHICWKG